MIKMTGLSHLFKWENLHNWWLTKYFFAPLYVYIYIYIYIYIVLLYINPCWQNELECARSHFELQTKKKKRIVKHFCFGRFRGFHKLE